jgi:CheY-like chemotaxis protein
MRRTATILIVEDDPNDRFFVERVFRKANLSAHLQFAIDGKEAMDYLSGRGKFQDRDQFPIPALILLDLKMPHVTGFEVLEWLKGQEGLKRVPVTVLTSSTIQSDINRAYELGANAYLVKPLSFDQLEKLYNKATEFFTVDAAAPTV